MLLADISIYREPELVNKKFEGGHKIDWDAVKKNLQESMGGEKVYYSDSKEIIGIKGDNVAIYMTLENFVHPDAAGLTFPGSFQPQINEYGINKSIKNAENKYNAGNFMIKNMLTNVSLHEIARALGRNGYSEKQNDLMYKELKYPNFFTKPLKFSVEDRQMIDQFLNR